MFWLQYGLKSDLNVVGMHVDAVWITDGKLVISPTLENENEEILLNDIDFANFEEKISKVEIKEFELHNKIVDLIDDLTALSKKQRKVRDQWQGKDDEMFNYHQGRKNAVDLCIVKLNETLGFYDKIEKGGK